MTRAENCSDSARGARVRSAVGGASTSRQERSRLRTPVSVKREPVSLTREAPRGQHQHRAPFRSGQSGLSRSLPPTPDPAHRSARTFERRTNDVRRCRAPSFTVREHGRFHRAHTTPTSRSLPSARSALADLRGVDKLPFPRRSHDAHRPLPSVRSVGARRTSRASSSPLLARPRPPPPESPPNPSLCPSPPAGISLPETWFCSVAAHGGSRENSFQALGGFN